MSWPSLESLYPQRAEHVRVDAEWNCATAGNKGVGVRHEKLGEHCWAAEIKQFLASGLEGME
jgi:hypothetical protein